jgi:TolA-binding protein
MESSNSKRIPEIARMTGEAMYQAKKYSEALPYFELYLEKTKLPVSRIDNYELGYIYFKLQNCEKAIENFNKAVSESDTLSQNAFYHLGDCYVRKGQKKFALNSFYSAYKEGFNKEVREDALFNYAKLSYELGYNPYNEAIKALKQYLQEYPESKRLDEAYTYLINLFMSTKNYKDALAILDNIKTKNEKLKAANIRLNYLYGVELFNAGDYKGAVDLFKKVADNTYDREISANSWFWLGEAKYRLGNYDEAATKYRQFLTTPGAFSLEFYKNANYNLGYCYFKQKEYEKALTEFRKFIAAGDKNDMKVQCDGLLRTADCFFVLKRYDDAIIHYDQAAKMKKADIDYALYQKALALGAAGRLKEKAETIQELIKAYPKSNLADEAKYELGITYLAIGEQMSALASFKKLIQDHPENKLVKNALLRMGLIYYNTNSEQEALTTFKKVVSEYPGTSESKEALVSIRNIYVDMNKVDDFFLYAKNIPFANVTNAEQDSITYQAAENQYMGGDCNSSSQGFKNYLEKFQKGIFRLNASFYFAECLFRENRTDEAIPYYQYVVDNQKSKFTETALMNMANYYYSRKDFENAYDKFSKLEKEAENPTNQIAAITGVMRCNYQLKQYTNTIDAGRKLVGLEKVSSELSTEAHLTMAKSAYENKQTDLAQTEFETTYKLTKGIRGAESKYYLSLIQFDKGNYKETEKLVFEFINEFSANDELLAKSFILLSDVYVKLGNNVQARQTLQSIIDNYEGADLVEVAKQKLTAINDAEKAEIMKKEEEVQKAKEAEINNEIESLINENK